MIHAGRTLVRETNLWSKKKKREREGEGSGTLVKSRCALHFLRIAVGSRITAESPSGSGGVRDGAGGALVATRPNRPSFPALASCQTEIAVGAVRSALALYRRRFS